LLDILVKIDAEKHPKKAEEINFKRKTHGEFDQDQIDSQWWADAGGKTGGENRLNRALGGHDPKDFPQYPAQ